MSDEVKGKRLPKDTLNILESCKDIDNAYLRYYRYAELIKVGKKENKYAYKLTTSLNGEVGELLDFEKITERLETTAKLISQQSKLQCWKQTTSSRMIVGMGGASVYENSLTLHHIYGFPYIPASGIKGVVRSYLIRCFFELTDVQKRNYPLTGDNKNDKENLKKRDEALEQNAMQDSVFAAIFGTNDKASGGSTSGSIIFFDSYPTTAPTVEVDVMTPHYDKWYGASEGDVYSNPPADIYNPVPLTFLTVAAGVGFQFVLGEQKLTKELTEAEKSSSDLINDSNLELDEEFSLTKIAAYWLKRALSEHGIGAKTAVGYGFFEEAQ